MTGSGTALDPYVIWDVNDLQDMSLDPTAVYELGQDIDAAATAGWNPTVDRGNWAPATAYNVHDFVWVVAETKYYICTTAHVSGGAFDPANWGEPSDTIPAAFLGFEPVHIPDPGTSVRILPGSDDSQGGSWNIFPSDGIYWNKVDDFPNDGDATYIEATANNSWVLFGLAAPIAIPADASCINVEVCIDYKDMGPWPHIGYIHAYVKIDGQVYQNRDPELGTRDHYWASPIYIPFTVNPKTGEPWTHSDLAHIQAFGVYVTGVTTEIYRFSAINLRVSYGTFSFDGRGYTISNLHFDRAGLRQNALLGSAYFTKLENIHIRDLSLVSDRLAGALIGEPHSFILRNCSATGSIYSTNRYVGGLLGECSGATQYLERCWSSCPVTGDNRYVGGLVGWGACIFVDCFSTGDVAAALYYVGGLIGYTGESYFTRCYATGNITGVDHVGGLVGVGGRDFTDCYATGKITAASGHAGGLIGSGGRYVIRCHATGDVIAAGDYVGGLIGDGGSIIEDCYATGKVTGAGKDIGGLVGESGTIRRSFATGNVEATGGGQWRIGGLVGDGGGPIENCYARGSVKVTSGTDIDEVGGLIGGAGANILNCYSTGLVEVSAPTITHVGGLVGENDGTVINSFWDTQTSRQATSDGGIGKTTAEMKTLATFLNASWDIGEHRSIDLNNGYPFLSWQIPGSSPIWYLYVPGVTPPPIPKVTTLAATEIR